MAGNAIVAVKVDCGSAGVRETDGTLNRIKRVDANTGSSRALQLITTGGPGITAAQHN
jgi:hypothetical protein